MTVDDEVKMRKTPFVGHEELEMKECMSMISRVVQETSTYVSSMEVIEKCDDDLHDISYAIVRNNSTKVDSHGEGLQVCQESLTKLK